MIGVLFVRGLFVCRWGSAAGDISRRFLPPGSSGLLLSSAWKVTFRAAWGGVRLWCWAPADLLAPRGGCGVREEAGRGWTNSQSGLRAGSHRGATPGGRLRGLCEWLVRATCLGESWAVRDSWRWCPVAMLDCRDVLSDQGLSDAEGRSAVRPPMQSV